MKFFDAIPQVLKLWGWYISKNGAKRAPDIEKNGAGQVFLHYLGRNIKKKCTKYVYEHNPNSADNIGLVLY